MVRFEKEMSAAAETRPEGTLERIVAICRAYCDFALAQPSGVRLMFALTRDHGDDEAVVVQGNASLSVVAEAIATLDEFDERTAGPKAVESWAFVHGLLFLMIDKKVRVSGIEIDLETMLHDVSRRMLGRDAT